MRDHGLATGGVLEVADRSDRIDGGSQRAGHATIRQRGPGCLRHEIHGGGESGRYCREVGHTLAHGNDDGRLVGVHTGPRWRELEWVLIQYRVGGCGSSREQELAQLGSGR